MSKGFDLSNYSSLASSEGAWLHLRDPYGDLLYNVEDKPVRLQLVGQDSPRIVEVRRDALRRELNSKKGKLSPHENEKQRVEGAARATIAWEGFMLSGKPLDFSTDNAKMVYSRPECLFILEQLEAFVMDRTNFLSKSATD